MSNEELVIRIKTGQAHYIETLWQQVVRFVDMSAGKLLEGYPEHYKQLRCDMVNEAYFSLLKAVEKYDPEKGSFINYLSWYIRPAFEKVLHGRGERLHNEPLNQAVSLDVPLSDTDDLTLADTLVDQESEVYYRRIEDNSFWKSVNVIFEEAIDRIKDRVGAEIIRYMYQNDCSIKAAAKALYDDKPVPYDRYKKAMRQIREYMYRTATRTQIEKAGLDNYIPRRGYGIRAFKENLYTSTVENIAIRKADSDLILRDIIEII